ncbi:TIGR03620 family F420-dependent LLM class oxidoreductase [Streptomyces corynorhini]|uniref:TIGR03620 family F420-dependent LLM class oxidoreductase n=1 Tax=Streptomyces corynorhini TaxID=2282652 RepID=A0A370B225_9ACTN|nr:TIGR03620 family F420-dependent LLM class oxidoreductase [Streptomyces corynorhini]RDG34712.1 TIGR03620 family F420-dependent LLM class oxidoreductase [Streptomyces corynorhini]
MDLGAIGVWSTAFTHGDRAEAKEAAAELEALGYGSLWLGGTPGGNPRGDLATAAELLGATGRVTVATGCVSIWDQPAELLAAAYHALPERQRRRLLVGLAVSHAEFVDRYRDPRTALASYLDALDRAVPALPPAARIVGAHGPGMTRLAAARSLGVHSHLVDVTHTARARAALGRTSLLAVEVTVVPHHDARTARPHARRLLAPFLKLANYRRAWLRRGFAQEDLADGGSDRLVDALFLYGKPDEIAQRLAAYRRAGADHIAVQVVTAGRGLFARTAWRDLATVFR